MLVAYNNLKNAVYSGLFKIEIKTSNFTVSDFLICNNFLQILLLYEYLFILDKDIIKPLFILD